MERIPETLKLTEDDIREAIQYWLQNEHQYEADFDIEFHVTKDHQYPKDGPIGGMRDPIEIQIISATAVADD